MAALLVSFGMSSHAQEVSSPEARAWLQKTFPQQSSEGHYLISSNVLEKSGNWYCGEDNEKFSCRTITVFPSMSFSVSKKGEFDVSLTPPTSALKDAENINDISLNFSNGDTVYIRHTWNFDREGDDIRAFIHALTSSKNVNLTFNGDMQRWTLPLSGTSRAVDSMAFWAAEHRVSLPFPFYQAKTAEAADDGAVSFHTAQAAVSGEEKHGQNNIGSALPMKDKSPALNKHSGSCHDDWRACKDISDMANNWSGYNRIRSECDAHTDSYSKYGSVSLTSIFLGGSYSSFFNGSLNKESVEVILMDNMAHVPDRNGNMRPMKASCFYDVTDDKIDNIVFDERD
ncbi:hypothetical protein GS537_06240 [Saccharibacter sp. EH60]|nr:hypothetical protein [Saccharibacter sp. EH60]